MARGDGHLPRGGVEEKVVQVPVPDPEDVGAGVQGRQRPREPSPAAVKQSGPSWRCGDKDEMG